MPYNPAGLYSLVASYFATPGQTIRTEQHNPPLEDIASALSNVLVRDGRAPMTGPLNMNGQVINNVAVGSSPTSVATLSQATPVGAGMDYWGSTAPTLWLFAAGQAVSRTTYETLFAVIGTTYGAGDGSTTFNLPDIRGRTSVGKDNMGGSAAGRMTTAGSGVDGLTVGASGGNQAVTLDGTMIPSHTHTGTTSSDGLHVHIVYGNALATGPGGGSVPDNATGNANKQTSADGAHTHTFTTNATGGGAAHANVQPSIVCNYIIYAAA